MKKTKNKQKSKAQVTVPVSAVPFTAPVQIKKPMAAWKPMVLAAAGLGLAIIHLSKWGPHSLSIVYLKTAQVIGLAGENQYEKLTSICHQTKNYSCVESALKGFYRSTNNPEHLKKLALLQFKLKKNEASAINYKKYFESGSFDAQSAYNLAGILDEIGNKEEALSYYDQILAQQEKNSVFVGAVRKKIELLVRMNRKTEAMQTIKAVKLMSSDHDSYMKQEIQRWEDQVKKG